MYPHRSSHQQPPAGFPLPARTSLPHRSPHASRFARSPSASVSRFGRVCSRSREYKQPSLALISSFAHVAVVSSTLVRLVRASTSPYHTFKSPRPLVPLRSRHCCPSTCGLSNWSSSSGLSLFFTDGESHLEVGFPLRCFQRLSAPKSATRLCRWHDNRLTGASSTPVLSY